MLTPPGGGAAESAAGGRQEAAESFRIKDLQQLAAINVGNFYTGSSRKPNGINELAATCQRCKIRRMLAPNRINDLRNPLPEFFTVRAEPAAASRMQQLAGCTAQRVQRTIINRINHLHQRAAILHRYAASWHGSCYINSAAPSPLSFRSK